MGAFIIQLLTGHASAPLWRAPALPEADLAPALAERQRAFEGSIDAARRDRGLAGVILREAVESALERARTRTAQGRRQLASAPAHVGIEDIPRLPTVGRADLAARPEAFIPEDADLEALRVARAPLPASASARGARGEALVPTEDFAHAAEAALLLAALRRRGIEVERAPDLLLLLRIDEAPPREGAGGEGARLERAEGASWPEAAAGGAAEPALPGPAWPEAMPEARSGGAPAAGEGAAPPSGWGRAGGTSGSAPGSGSWSARGGPHGALASPGAGGAARAATPAPAGGVAPRGAFCVGLGALGGAGYARCDLAPSSWRNTLDPVRFIAAFAPAVVAAPLAALEDLAARQEELFRAAGPGAPRMRVRALVAPAGAPVPRPLRDRLERAFSAPLIEWYAVPEAGPIAVGCKVGRGLHVLPPDLLVESDAATGEVALTGGRNALLPLVRYRPGDRGRVDEGPCSCGDPSPRIVGLERG
jgi:hypothetical protein